MLVDNCVEYRTRALISLLICLAARPFDVQECAAEERGLSSRQAILYLPWNAYRPGTVEIVGQNPQAMLYGLFTVPE